MGWKNVAVVTLLYSFDFWDPINVLPSKVIVTIKLARVRMIEKPKTQRKISNPSHFYILNKH